jgi:hypothetical protein
MSLFSGLSRPLKAAGLALVGLGIVAAVIGGVTALNSGDSSNIATPRTSAPPPSGTTAPSPISSAPSASPSSSASPSPSMPLSSSAPTGPAPAQGGQPPTGDQQASAKWVVVRVYNNSTIHGLAARAAEDFRGAGWNVVDVSNYSAGIIPATTAFYRPGTDEETAAKALAAEFRMHAEPRFEGIQQSSPGVIVIVTNNYAVATRKSGS